jgi:hypothetical protein
VAEAQMKVGTFLFTLCLCFGGASEGLLAQAPPVVSTAVLDATLRGFYQTRKYSAMVELLQTAITRLDAPKYRALLALAALRTGDRELAQQQLSALSTRTDEGSSEYFSQIRSDLEAYDQAVQTRDAFLQAVAEHRPQDAKAQAAGLPLNEAQRLQIDLYLSIFQGEYDAARAQLLKLSAAADVDSVALNQQINTLAETYTSLLKAVQNNFLYSAAAVSFCDTGDAENEKEVFQVSIGKYEKLVAQLNATAPLSDTVLDLLFHAQMLLGNYPALEKLGDSILNAKGTIRIPFYSRDSFFTFVIDKKEKALRTEPDPHPFYATYAVNGFGSLKAGPLNKWNGTTVPFNFKFEQIESISQKAGANDGHMAKDAYALRINNTGTAPHYALMHVLSCTQGPVAEKTVTHDFGEYIIHVVGSPELKASLQDTKAPSKFGRAFSTYGQLAAVVASGQAGTPLGQLATSQIMQQTIQEDLSKNWVAQNRKSLELLPPMAFTSSGVANHFKSLIDSLMSN